MARAGIGEVSVERKSRKRNVWWGLAIGAAASFVVGLKCAGESEGCNESAPAWFYPLAGAGAAITSTDLSGDVVDAKTGAGGEGQG